MEARLPSESRQRILTAAKEVFAAKGYRGGSLNEVARRSGLTRPGLLHHYPSKEALLLGLLDARDERLQVNDLGVDSEEGIQELLERVPALVGLILEDRDLIQLAHALTSEASHPDHPAHAWAARRHQTLRDGLTAAIERSVQRGELADSTDAESLAAVLLGAIEGVERQWLVDPRVDPRRCAVTLVAMVDALVAQSARSTAP